MCEIIRSFLSISSLSDTKSAWLHTTMSGALPSILAHWLIGNDPQPVRDRVDGGVLISMETDYNHKDRGTRVDCCFDNGGMTAIVGYCPAKS